jgi:hypothetical protein
MPENPESILCPLPLARPTTHPLSSGSIPKRCVGRECRLFASQGECVLAAALGALSNNDFDLVVGSVHREIEAMIDDRIQKAVRQLIPTMRG